VTNHAIAREILRGNSYVVLATADGDGLPWVCPVWFAMEGYQGLYWISYPGARHSHNIAVRPQIAMVVFDSTVAPGTGQAVYMQATAAEVTDPDAVEHGIGVYSRASVRDGIKEFGVGDVTGQARLRLYRANVDEHWILDPDSRYDVRTPVTP
jgi:nitroimidazol reductase NimA-like FMN-containing flavoprotein (pyridoxamine 5'-phosphate oxidase superfamily)